MLRKASQLEASLVRTGALTGIQYKFIVRQSELWPELREIIQEEVRISSSSAHMDDTAWASCSSVQSRNKFSVRPAARS